MNDHTLAAPATVQPPRRPTVRLLLSHPAHVIALGFGSGLSPFAPGTVGTLWAWISFLVLNRYLGPLEMATLLAASFFVGWWACTVTARAMAIPDPGAIVCDEVLAFWLVLWLVMPAGLLAQAVAFALFRYFDAAKPGPVAWADRAFKVPRGQPIGWAQGFGILFDDLVAALCTLLVIAGWRWFWP
ncbi:MAG: phosphatidylglycerophosphatase A [Burkholderiaceae bacterium]|nr:phosphatidylglycerophosphatase A [Burkholderiaceae bacterium]